MGSARGSPQWRRTTGSRSASSWLLVLLTATLAAAAAAVGTWIALRYTPSELADVMRIPTAQVFDRLGRERLGVGESGLLLLSTVTPSALVGGMVVITARLSAWWMLAPPVVAVALGVAGSAAAVAAGAGPGCQLAAGCAAAGVGACLGVAGCDRLHRPGS
jgi:hypothetical protein